MSKLHCTQAMRKSAIREREKKKSRQYNTWPHGPARSISLSLLQQPAKADQSKVPANASTPILQKQVHIIMQMASIYTFNCQYYGLSYRFIKFLHSSFIETVSIFIKYVVRAFKYSSVFPKLNGVRIF